MYNLDAIVFSDWEISLVIFFFFPPQLMLLTFFPKNGMMMELNCCSRLDKFINVINQIMIPNKCGSSTRQQLHALSEASSIPPLP